MTLQTGLAAGLGRLVSAINALDTRVKAGDHRRRDLTNRFYFYTDGRWVSLGDANYGIEDINSTENAGLNPTPLIEWENRGLPFEAGDKITRLEMRLRANNLEVADVEFYIVFSHPDAETRWVTGYDADGEVDHDVLYQSVHKGRVSNPLTANINDLSRQVVDLDYTCPVSGDLRVFVRATGTVTATRYCYCQTIVHYNEVLLND